MLLRILTLITVFAVAGQAHAFSSNFTLFTDSSITDTDAGADGLWHTCDDAVNNANPLGAVSYIYKSDTGPFVVDSYEGFGIGNFILESPGTGGAGTADYSAMNLIGTTPSSGALPFQIGTLSLSNTTSSSIEYAPGSNNMIFNSNLTVQSTGGTDFSLTGTGYTIYNAAGLDDPSIFGGVFGSEPFYESLAAHFDYLLGLAPESWTAITVDFLDLDNSDLSVVLSSYSVDENLLSSASAVPLPPALWLFGAALIGLINCPRKNSSI